MHKIKNFPLVGGSKSQVKICFSVDTDEPNVQPMFLDIVLNEQQAESLIESLSALIEFKQ